MVLRSIVHRHMRCVTTDRREALPPLGKATIIALCFAIVSLSWGAFRYVESTVYPVISDFEITHIRPDGNSVVIYGRFDKKRDCSFVDVVGYSGQQFVTVVFEEYPDAPSVSRVPRLQTFGPWRLVPKTPTLELYSHHICATGMVETKLFSGALVL